MTKTDRLFAILLHLQHRRRVTADELAARLEVSVRTIYRDMDALSQAGVPVVALAGDGYRLPEGFFLPPLGLSADEAVAVTLGLSLLQSQASGRLTDAAGQAALKVASILPVSQRQEADGLREVLGFLPPRRPIDLDDPVLLQLRTAIVRRQPMSLRYHSRSEDRETRRIVEPWRLSHHREAWHLSAWCRLRRDRREFRLDRITGLTPLVGAFEGPEPGEATLPALDLEIRVRFPLALRRWVVEQQHYGYVDEVPDGEGHVIMRYTVADLTEILPWLRSWGPEAQPLAPESLVARLRAEAAQRLTLLT